MLRRLQVLIAGLLVAGSLGVNAASAQVPTPDVPDLPVPEVPTLPDPTVVPTPLPVPSLPPAPTPPPLPKTPSVPKVPSVPTVPSVPSVPKAPSAPKAPSVPNAPSSPRLPGQGQAPAGQPDSGTPSSPGGAASPDRAGGGVAGPGGASARRLRSGASAMAAGEPRPIRTRVARRERRMRATVARFAGCLGALPDRQADVLRLRAGVGSRPALSPLAVAEKLRLRPRKVTRLERRGLHRLRALARASGCGGESTGAAGGSATGGGSAGAAGDSASAAAGGSASASGTEEARGAVLGVSRSKARDADSGASDERSISLSDPRTQGSIALILILLGLLAFALRYLRSANTGATGTWRAGGRRRTESE